MTPKFPAANSAIAQPSNASVATSLFFVLLLVDIFFSFSRFLEVFPIGVGPVSLAMTIRVILLMGALVGGRVLTNLSTPIGVRLVLFSLWFVVCTAFSSWRGGSVSLLLHFWGPGVVAFIAASNLLGSTKQVRQAFFTMGFASATIAIMSVLIATRVQGRTAVDAGTLGNPNDLALLLLIGAPGIILFFQSNRRRQFLLRTLLLASSLLILKTVAGTASRAGLMTLLIFGVLAFLFGSSAVRWKIAVGGFAAMVAFLAIAPRDALVRYSTIIPFLPSGLSSADRMEQASAEASTDSRRMLLKDSLILTLRNPVFGVGPGTYTAAEAQMSKEENRKADWHESHNTYTQISSETGIPGFLLYMSIIWACVRAPVRILRQVRGIPALLPLRQLAICAILMMACFAFNALFGSLGYLTLLPFLAGVISVLDVSAQREILAWREAVKARGGEAAQRPGAAIPVRPLPSPARA